MLDFPRPILAVHQPNYAPWLGWFVKAAVADRFVLLDDAQYPKGSWVNRTKVLGPSGPDYLTIPVAHPGRIPIKDVRVSDSGWAAKHLRKMESFYPRTVGLDGVRSVLAEKGLSDLDRLAEANEVVLRRLLAALGVERDLVRSSSLGIAAGDPTDRHIALCRAVGAKTYLSGQGAAAYNDAARFEAAGIALAYLAFDHPVYPQGGGEFVPGLSALDLICRTGHEAPRLVQAAVSATRLSSHANGK